MINFNYSIPTKIFFGKDQINVLGEQIKKYGSRVLLVYGGKSIKANGIYDKVIKIMEENNISYWELSGVEPNPRIQSVRDGVKICKKNKIDFVLAVGGGSVIDCSKVIAAGNYYEGDSWDFLIGKAKVAKVLPIASVLTLSATGSEMDAGAVISNPETEEKLAVGHPDMAPKFSILDPTYTFTVSKKQTAAGTADIMSHIFEVYLNKTPGAFIQNRLAEAILKTCIHYGPIAINKPDDYEARANLMWASSLAINGLLTYGKQARWSAHPMEHELSAFYDITHGEGLAILTPVWMKYVLNDETVDHIAEYGINVFGLDEKNDKYANANEAIKNTRNFFNSIGLPSKLKEVGIGEEKLEIMAKATVRYGDIEGFYTLKYNDVLNIFKAAL